MCVCVDLSFHLYALDPGEHARVSHRPRAPARGFGEGGGAVLAGQRGRSGEGELGPPGVDPEPRAV